MEVRGRVAGDGDLTPSEQADALSDAAKAPRAGEGVRCPVLELVLVVLAHAQLCGLRVGRDRSQLDARGFGWRGRGHGLGVQGGWSESRID